MYKVGIKVVCLTSNWSDKDVKNPVKGHPYTIRGIRIFPSGVMGLIFEEIKNTPMHYSDGFYEMHFWANNFRPIIYDFDINYEILKNFKPIEEKSDIKIVKPITSRK